MTSVTATPIEAPAGGIIKNEDYRPKNIMITGGAGFMYVSCRFVSFFRLDDWMGCCWYVEWIGWMEFDSNIVLFCLRDVLFFFFFFLLMKIVPRMCWPWWWRSIQSTRLWTTTRWTTAPPSTTTTPSRTPQTIASWREICWVLICSITYWRSTRSIPSSTLRLRPTSTTPLETAASSPRTTSWALTISSRLLAMPSQRFVASSTCPPMKSTARWEP